MGFIKRKQSGSDRVRHRKKGITIFVFFRVILSLIILAILAVFLLQAVRTFSGIDPLKISPSQIAKNVFSTDIVYGIATGMLNLQPTDAVQKVENIVGITQSPSPSTSPIPSANDVKKVKFKFAIVADSDLNYHGLQEALAQAKQKGAKFIIGIGDFSDIGTVDELTKTKQQFDLSPLPYYVIPGDHDLWDSRNRNLPAVTDFKQVFNTPLYQAVSYSNIRLILMDNSDDYLGISNDEMSWLDSEVPKFNQDPAQITFAFVSTPLYYPSSDHAMGRLTPSLANQAQYVITDFKRIGVNEVFAGDTHYFFQYVEPTSQIHMTAVGAVTDVDNAQSPRYTIVDVNEDGSYNIQDTEIQQ